MKKRYVLKKEIKEELVQLGIEILGLTAMAGIIILLIMINGILF